MKLSTTIISIYHSLCDEYYKDKEENISNYSLLYNRILDAPSDKNLLLDEISSLSQFHENRFIYDRFLLDDLLFSSFFKFLNLNLVLEKKNENEGYVMTSSSFYKLYCELLILKKERCCSFLQDKIEDIVSNGLVYFEEDILIDWIEKDFIFKNPNSQQFIENYINSSEVSREEIELEFDLLAYYFISKKNKHFLNTIFKNERVEELKFVYPTIFHEDILIKTLKEIRNMDLFIEDGPF